MLFEKIIAVGAISFVAVGAKSFVALKCISHDSVLASFNKGDDVGGKTGSRKTEIAGKNYQSKPPSDSFFKSSYRFGSDKFRGAFTYIEACTSVFVGEMQGICDMHAPLESCISRDEEGILWYHSKYKEKGHEDIDARYAPFLKDSDKDRLGRSKSYKNPLGNHHVTFISNNSHSTDDLIAAIASFKVPSKHLHLKAVKNMALSILCKGSLSEESLKQVLGDVLAALGLYHIDFPPTKDINLSELCKCLALSTLLGNDDPNAANIMVDASGNATLIDVNGLNMQRRANGRYYAQNTANGTMDFINNTTVMNFKGTVPRSKLQRDYPGLFYSSLMATTMRDVSEAMRDKGSRLVASLKKAWIGEIERMGSENVGSDSARLDQIEKELTLLVKMCIDSEPPDNAGFKNYTHNFRKCLKNMGSLFRVLKASNFSEAGKRGAKECIRDIYDQVGNYVMRRNEKMAVTAKLMMVQTVMDAELQELESDIYKFDVNIEARLDTYLKGKYVDPKAREKETLYDALLDLGSKAKKNGFANEGGGFIWMRPNVKMKSKVSVTSRPRGTVEDYIKGYMSELTKKPKQESTCYSCFS
jgi:hypothetical protein